MAPHRNIGIRIRTSYRRGYGKWLLINRAAAELFDLQDKNYHGKADMELGEMVPFYRDILAYCRNSDENAWLRKGLSRAEETIPQHNNKEPRIFDVIKIPLFEQDGSRKGLVVIGRDMTEHKNMEDKLNLASEVFENTTEGIVITDVNANILSINPAFTAVTGYTAEEAIGKNMRLLKSGRHDAKFYKGMWMALSTAGSWHGEIWNRRKNGESPAFPTACSSTTTLRLPGLILKGQKRCWRFFSWTWTILKKSMTPLAMIQATSCSSMLRNVSRDACGMKIPLPV
ncbi:MAG: PAS domain S-box protein [Deltaproteobacteria bacterium]|nr:PAS domain S-box protein [Deltaproteobacteria bacterium]